MVAMSCKGCWMTFVPSRRKGCTTWTGPICLPVWHHRRVSQLHGAMLWDSIYRSFPFRVHLMLLKIVKMRLAELQDDALQNLAIASYCWRTPLRIPSALASWTYLIIIDLFFWWHMRLLHQGMSICLGWDPKNNIDICSRPTMFCMFTWKWQVNYSPIPARGWHFEPIFHIDLYPKVGKPLRLHSEVVQRMAQRPCCQASGPQRLRVLHHLLPLKTGRR